MSSVLTVPVLMDAPASMPRKKHPDAEPTEGGQVQINFKAQHGLAQRLRAVADGLGLDLANLVRMMVKENLPRYEARVEEINRPKQSD